ncbi:MAG TPA: DEAD/DEAH box helicase [Thermoanaerobaculia bacterium]|nr:DEAD/DEAH box helicase [Thermoanaerobaculia bacterium]
MNLASTLARFVDLGVRKRGLQYFQARRVVLSFCGPHQVNAVVTGSETYFVSLSRSARSVRSTCTCPYADRGAPCKHIWAAILAADAQGCLRGADGTMPDELTCTPSPEVREAGARPQPGPPIRRTAGPKPPPTWRDIINQLDDVAPFVPALTSDIVYVIDARATVDTQQVTLEVFTSRKKLDGTLGKLSTPHLVRTDLPGLPDPADQKILSLLAGAALGEAWTASRYPSATQKVPTRCVVPKAAEGVLLPLIFATGRTRLRRGPESEVGGPLAWNGDEPWKLWLEVREEEGGTWVVAGSLRRGDVRMTPRQPELVLRSGFVFAGGEVSRLEDAGAFRWLALLSRDGALRVPAAELDDLLERLFASPTVPALDLPESLRIAEAHPAAQPRLRLLAPSGPGRDGLGADLSFLYDGREVPAESPGRGIYYRDEQRRDERRLLLRDPEAERRQADRLLELGFRKTSDRGFEEPALRVPASRVPKAVRALLAEGWSVEAEGKLYRSSSGPFKMNVASGVDWFELHGGVDFEGETVELPALLAALRRGDGFIPLGDGSLGALPEDWLKKLGPMAALGQAEGDHLRFTPAQAALLDAWLADEPDVTFDDAFERARQRLQGFAGVAPADAPPGFHGELRGYQRAGLGWLHFLRDFGFGGCLADDMGLGKTIQVLALLETRRVLRAVEGLPPSLVVVPRSLVFNWLAEAAKFTPELRVLDYTGTGRRARQEDPFADCDVVLTTYGTLRRDIAALRQREFDYVILDEAQAIKNAASQTAQAARLLRGRHRLALSGTPVENHLGELWSLLGFLNPGLLGASPLLATRSEELRDPDPGARELLARALRPFILRRTKEQVAPELPAKVEQTLFCELPPKQRRHYDELRDHYRTALGSRIDEQGLGRNKILVLEALLRLRQAACHPGLLDPDRAHEPSAKLDLLVPQLHEILAEGHKALVFSQFTSFLALLRDRLDREGVSYLYLDGRTRARREKVETFQSDPTCQLFLISLKAGGLGLNLTAADYVYLLDPWWNPAVESQAIDRAHRIGQTRPVFASRLVVRDTVEEKILELQKSKRDLADAVIQADGSVLASLSREDLELLLS